MTPSSNKFNCRVFKNNDALTSEQEVHGGKMKRTLLISTLRTLLVLLLVFCLNTIASADSKKSRANRIVGVWDVTVTIYDCSTGDALFTFPGLHKYELGGTGQVVPATNPAGLSAHMTTWSYVSKNDYTLTVKMFSFDPTGTNVGYNIIRGNVSINDNATQYTGSGQASFYDVNGNLLGMSCPSFTGVRLQ
jgi:hypothetical protein